MNFLAAQTCQPGPAEDVNQLNYWVNEFHRLAEPKEFLNMSELQNFMELK